MLKFFRGLIVLIALLMVLNGGFYLTAMAEQSVKPAEKAKEYVVDLKNEICPVMGDTAQKELYVIYNNKVYHLCCLTCVAEFKKDPAKYVKVVKAAPVSEQEKYEIVANDKCPVTGDAVDKNISAIKNGKVYYFCCPSCIDKFKGEEAVKKTEK